MKNRHLMGRVFVLLPAIVLLVGSLANASSTNRGVWCWPTPSPYGLNYIVGSNALQNAAVAQFKAWGISRVYGVYGDQLWNAPGQTALAAWNTLLNNNGIESQLLISDWTLNSGQQNVILQMIDFNNSQPPAARFKGIHLDLEPWGLPSWPTDNKYNDLVNLAAEYQQVRTELDANGQSNVLVYADQSDWLETTAINWPSDSARSQWYSGIFTNLAGVTLMAYEQPTYSGLVNVVSWEMTNYPGLFRVGIDVGVGQTWSILKNFLFVANLIESKYSDSAGVDFYDFQTFEQIVPPVIGLGSAPLLNPNGFNLMVQGPIGSNCIVQASTNFVTWQMATNFSSPSWLTYITDSTATNYPYRFYRVTN